MSIPEEIEDFARAHTQEEYKKKFLSLESAEEFAELFGLTYEQLSGLIYAPGDRKYFIFHVPKKSGGTRQIMSPSKELKALQRKVNYVLQSTYEPKAATHGFVPGRSIVTNAKAHTGASVVLNLDLKDFFPSIHFGRVQGMMRSVPYELPPDVATVVAQTCSLGDRAPEGSPYRNTLPQGAPTSPTIANMVCAKLDSELTYLAKECRATYTRYADDITFSTSKPEMDDDIVLEAHEESSSPLDVQLGERLTSIIQDNGFVVNQEKVRIQRSDIRQEVTGLVVNEFVNVPRELVRQVRAMLHAWRKFGLEDAHDHHVRKYYDAPTQEDAVLSQEVAEEDGEGKGTPRFEDVLRGRIEYIGMVRGKDNSIYKKYRSQYDELADRDLQSAEQDTESSKR